MNNLLMLVFLVCASTRGALLNGTAAIINKKVITIQDVYVFRSLLRFKAKEAKVVSMEEGEELKKSLHKLVFEELVYLELQNISPGSAGKHDGQKWLSTERKSGREASYKEILKHFALDESAVVQRLSKHFDVEEFLKRKVETMTPVITVEEAQKYYKENESRFRGSSFESLKPSIVILLKKQSLQKSLEEWISFLKDKYGVLNLLE